MDAYERKKQELHTAWDEYLEALRDAERFVQLRKQAIESTDPATRQTAYVMAGNKPYELVQRKGEALDRIFLELGVMAAARNRSTDI